MSGEEQSAALVLGYVNAADWDEEVVQWGGVPEYAQEPAYAPQRSSAGPELKPCHFFATVSHVPPPCPFARLSLASRSPSTCSFALLGCLQRSASVTTVRATRRGPPSF